MISRPTTEQIVLDCRRELIETIFPAVSDAAAALAVRMLENVLDNVATRAAHEIAWMTEEAADMVAYAAEVAVAYPGGELEVAVAAAAPALSLHLEDVVAAYSRAGEALSCATEAASAARDGARLRQAVELLERRTAREQEIKGEWQMLGRT